MRLEEKLERAAYCLIITMVCIFFGSICLGMIGLVISCLRAVIL